MRLHEKSPPSKKLILVIILILTLFIIIYKQSKKKGVLALRQNLQKGTDERMYARPPDHLLVRIICDSNSGGAQNAIACAVLTQPPPTELRLCDHHTKFKLFVYLRTYLMQSAPAAGNEIC